MASIATTLVSLEDFNARFISEMVSINISFMAWLALYASVQQWAVAFALEYKARETPEQPKLANRRVFEKFWNDLFNELTKHISDKQDDFKNMRLAAFAETILRDSTWRHRVDEAVDICSLYSSANYAAGNLQADNARREPDRPSDFLNRAPKWFDSVTMHHYRHQRIWPGLLRSLDDVQRGVHRVIPKIGPMRVFSPVPGEVTISPAESPTGLASIEALVGLSRASEKMSHVDLDAHNAWCDNLRGPDGDYCRNPSPRPAWATGF